MARALSITIIGIMRLRTESLGSASTASKGENKQVILRKTQGTAVLHGRAQTRRRMQPRARSPQAQGADVGVDRWCHVQSLDPRSRLLTFMGERCHLRPVAPAEASGDAYQLARQLSAAGSDVHCRLSRLVLGQPC